MTIVNYLFIVLCVYMMITYFNNEEFFHLIIHCVRHILLDICEAYYIMFGFLVSYCGNKSYMLFNSILQFCFDMYNIILEYIDVNLPEYKRRR